MPINTRDKRASVLGVNEASPRLEQNPSGTIAQSGRQIAGLIYAGILAGTITVVVSDNAPSTWDLPEMGTNAPGTLLGGDGGGLT